MSFYWAGVLGPAQSVEKSEIPVVKSPATWPKALHPIKIESICIMHDMAFYASALT